MPAGMPAAAAAGDDDANVPPLFLRAPCGSGSGIPAAGDLVALLSEASTAFAAALLALRSSAFRFFSSACARSPHRQLDVKTIEAVCVADDFLLPVC